MSSKTTKQVFVFWGTEYQLADKNTPQGVQVYNIEGKKYIKLDTKPVTKTTQVTKQKQTKHFSKFYIGLPVEYNGITRYQSTHLVYADTDMQQLKNDFKLFKNIRSNAKIIGISGTGKNASFEVVTL
jgi:transcriptional regulator with AAA-type ATPase domain